MLSRAVKIPVASAAVGIGIGIFAITLVQAFWYVPQGEAQEPAHAAEAPARALAPADEPARLVIPALGIDVRVEHLGMNASGSMDAPAAFSDAGWYKYGSVPGQPGTAVIAGHLDNGLGLDGAFKRLGRITVGDRVVVETKGGEEVAFIVSSIESYPYEKVPEEEIFTESGPSRLALITCGGSLLYAQRTYDHRLVVMAELARGD